MNFAIGAFFQSVLRFGRVTGPSPMKGPVGGDHDCREDYLIGMMHADSAWYYERCRWWS